MPGSQSSSLPRTKTPRARHPAVTILALIQLLCAVAYGTVFLALLLAGPELVGSIEMRSMLTYAVEMPLLIAATGTLAAASLVAGVLLLRMRQLGWTITMLLTGFGLMSSLFGWYSEGEVLSVWLLIQVVTVFYLNQAQVRQTFGISERVDLETPEGSRG